VTSLSATFSVPAADPKSNYLAHQEEIDQALRRALAGGSYILGNEVTAFEQEFADYLDVRAAVGVGNGTDALHLALRTCGIGHGDIVITVSHTAVATVAAIDLAGAIPFLVDIDLASFTMDPERLEDAIKAHNQRAGKSAGRLKAVIPVHLYGHPVDMPSIVDIARRNDLMIIEDCAQSHGAGIDGRKTGTWGDMAAFSFYPTKNLGALGDGGALVTSDGALATRASALREYGWRERYVSESRGMNTRLDELQAAVLRVKLKYLDEENARRQRIAGMYDAELSATGLILPQVSAAATHVYHQYVVRSQRRDDLRGFLGQRSIGTLIHYPLAVHMQPAYQGTVMTASTGLGNTEQVCGELLSLPMYPQLGDELVGSVTRAISEWAAQGVG
jgi:dTDP-4-amino-4,6-dideoxygalactose transaminase